MLTENDLRMLKSAELSTDHPEWAGVIPHGAADHAAIRRLLRMELVTSNGVAECVECGPEHVALCYVLTSAGKRIMQERRASAVPAASPSQATSARPGRPPRAGTR